MTEKLNPLQIDEYVAMITRWLRMFGRGVGVHASWGLALGLPVGRSFCLWLSFTQTTESCRWEPRIWVPGNPGGIFDRTVNAQHCFRV